MRKVEHATDTQRRDPLGITMNLVGATESALDDMREWYPAHMLELRVLKYRELDEDLNRVVVDGNLKLSRRICGRPVAELTKSKELGLMTAAPCSCTPSFKMRCCVKHCISHAPVETGPQQSEVIVRHRRKRILQTQAGG